MSSFGHFDSAAKEYVIHRPDTPKAWSNYMGSREYGGIITNGAGGYSFSRSPAEGRILRHRYNSVPMDLPGRQFYLRDTKSGDFWSAAWPATAKPLEAYSTETRFGTGYTIIQSKYAGIKTDSTYFIPLGAKFEYWYLRIRNMDQVRRDLQVFAYCEFTNEWNLVNDTLNLQYSQFISRAHFEKSLSGILASSCSHLPTDEANFSNRDQSRHWWMVQAETPVGGFDCDRDSFLGAYGSYHNPQAVVRGCCAGSTGFSDNLCGALQAQVSLHPGESVDVLILLGIGDKAAAESIRDSYGSAQSCREEFDRLKTYWHAILDRVQVRTPDPAFDVMANTWGAYNALITFEWSRSCSLVYTGDIRDGFGFRDTVQDCLGVIPLIPEKVRDRLFLLLSGQDSSGGAQPEIRPWSHRPGQMPPTPPEGYRSDDCLWLFNAVPLYVAETGETSFYDEVVPFADTGQGTVLEHMRRALVFNLERKGKHGIPCGLSADWNDCLKLGYRGESFFVAFQLRLALEVYARLAEERSLTGEAAWAKSELETLDAALDNSVWDGEWFRWAISESGTVFGTKNYPEGQVYLNTQAWAILSGYASPEQSKAALGSMRRHLASEWGLAMCAPPFQNTPVDVMRAVLFNPGNKENGGIFSHTQSWAVLAELQAGDPDRAYAYFRSFLPSAQNERTDIREVEPFVHCQSTHSQFSQKTGRSRVPWLSGTASWTQHAALHGILGLQPQPDGFRLDPVIPKDWNGFTVIRTFRGRMLQITVQNPHGIHRGIHRMTINGSVLEGNFIPWERLHPVSKIEAILEPIDHPPTVCHEHSKMIGAAGHH